MLFCPFAQRARLILKVKGVPHDIVNIHLQNKPEWLFELNPEGEQYKYFFLCIFNPSKEDLIKNS